MSNSLIPDAMAVARAFGNSAKSSIFGMTAPSVSIPVPNSSALDAFATAVADSVVAVVALVVAVVASSVAVVAFCASNGANAASIAVACAAACAWISASRAAVSCVKSSVPRCCSINSFNPRLPKRR